MYGHQISAFAGIHINYRNIKIYPLVVIIEYRKDDDIMEYKGIRMTLTDFIEFWKENDIRWSFDDTRPNKNPEMKDLFFKAWW